jgi:hypothetical protein
MAASLPLRTGARRALTILALSLLVLGLQSPEPVHAATFVVDTTTDDYTANGCTAVPADCSLRGAVWKANVTPGDDLITLPSGTYELAPEHYPGEPDFQWGDLRVTSDDALTIEGSGSTYPIIDANGSATARGAIWSESGSGTLTLRNMVITGGALGAIISYRSLTLDSVALNGNNSTGSGGAVYQWDSSGTLSLINGVAIYNNTSAHTGGGIYQHGGTLNISGAEFSNNHVTTNGPGGALTLDPAAGFSFSNVSFTGNSTPTGFGGGGLLIIDGGGGTFSNVEISGNVAGADGGGLVVAGATTLTMSDGMISANTSEGDGGGMAIGGGAAVTLERCELSGNVSNNAITASPGGGGAITVSSASLALTNTTVSGNQAKKDGGGIMTLYGNPQVTITASTLTANTPDSDGTDGGDGGGINVYGGTLTLVGSIVANNGGTECVHDSGTLISGGYNLSSDASCELDDAGDLPSTAPGLGPLANNGWWNRTHALLPGSPAIDAGDMGYCPSTDQRGFPRPVGGNCDMGAYEAPLWVWLPLVFRQFP